MTKVGRLTHDVKIRSWQEDDLFSFHAIYMTRCAASTLSNALTAISGCTGSALDCHRSSLVHAIMPLLIIIPDIFSWAAVVCKVINHDCFFYLRSEKAT